MPVVAADPLPGARVPVDPPDHVLVAALCDRDEGAYLALVRRHSPLMLRVARSHVGRREVAEDVVQDTWIAVLRHVDRFEGRSTFKTWLMRILVNTARTRRSAEARTVCWSSLPGDAPLWDQAAGAGADAAGPERRALSGEAWSAVRDALTQLPVRQRTVVVLRDVQGWTSEEVRAELGLTAGNQRVLLHRGRIRLRVLLDPHAPGGTSRADLQQTELPRPDDGVAAGGDPELAEHPSAVRLDGVEREVEHATDLAWGERPGEQRQECPLPVAERGPGGRDPGGRDPSGRVLHRSRSGQPDASQPGRQPAGVRTVTGQPARLLQPPPPVPAHRVGGLHAHGEGEGPRTTARPGRSCPSPPARRPR